MGEGGVNRDARIIDLGTEYLGGPSVSNDDHTIDEDTNRLDVQCVDRYTCATSRANSSTVQTASQKQSVPESSSITGSSIRDISTSEELTEIFKDLQVGQRAVIYFSADWCPVCDSFDPIFEQQARGADSRWNLFLRVRDEEIAHEYSVNTVPTVLVIDDLGRQRRLVGVSEITGGLIDTQELQSAELQAEDNQQIDEEFQGMDPQTLRANFEGVNDARRVAAIRNYGDRAPELDPHEALLGARQLGGLFFETSENVYSAAMDAYNKVFKSLNPGAFLEELRTNLRLLNFPNRRVRTAASRAVVAMASELDPALANSLGSEEANELMPILRCSISAMIQTNQPESLIKRVVDTYKVLASKVDGSRAIEETRSIRENIMLENFGSYTTEVGLFIGTIYEEMYISLVPSLSPEAALSEAQLIRPILTTDGWFEFLNTFFAGRRVYYNARDAERLISFARRAYEKLTQRLDHSGVISELNVWKSEMENEVHVMYPANWLNLPSCYKQLLSRLDTDEFVPEIRYLRSLVRSSNPAAQLNAIVVYESLHFPDDPEKESIMHGEVAQTAVEVRNLLNSIFDSFTEDEYSQGLASSAMGLYNNLIEEGDLNFDEVLEGCRMLSKYCGGHDSFVYTQARDIFHELMKKYLISEDMI